MLTMDEGVVLHDHLGHVLWSNPVAGQVLGVQQKHPPGATPSCFDGATFREDGSIFPAQEHPASVTLNTGEPCRNVVMGVQPQNGVPQIWISINTARMDGLVGGPVVLAVFTDITAEILLRLRLRTFESCVEAGNCPAF